MIHGRLAARRHTNDAIDPGFAGEVPYVVALIELDEGPRLLSNIIGIPPEAVACDMPVRVVSARSLRFPSPREHLPAAAGGA